MTALRLAIDQARARQALTPIAWVDPVITPGVTPIKAAHIAELRAAVLAPR